MSEVITARVWGQRKERSQESLENAILELDGEGFGVNFALDALGDGDLCRNMTKVHVPNDGKIKGAGQLKKGVAKFGNAHIAAFFGAVSDFSHEHSFTPLQDPGVLELEHVPDDVIKNGLVLFPKKNDFLVGELGKGIVDCAQK